MPRTLLFIGCAEGGAVDTLALDPATGGLEPLARTDGLGKVSSLALDPSGTLYAASNPGGGLAEPTITELAVDPRTGRTTPGARRTLPVTTCYTALGPGRRTLFGASYHQGTLVRTAVPAAGEDPAGEDPAGEDPAGGDAPSSYASGANTHCAVVSPDGRFVYAAALGSDRVSWFPADSTGTDVPPAGSVSAEPGSGPRHLRFNAGGDRVYVLHELSGEVAVYARDASTGGLSLLQRASAVEGLGLAPGVRRTSTTPDPGLGVVWCADLRLTPDGRCLFATERSTSTVAAFAVDDAGLLAFLRHTPTEAQPRGCAIDPSGRFLFVCGERSGHVTSYRIDPGEGSLEAVSRAQTAAGPLWIETWNPRTGR